jgi:hypothetical protein
MKQKLQQLWTSIFMIAIAFSIPTATHAAPLYNPLGTVNVPTLIGRVIQAALGISGSIALLMFVWGGFIWLTSQGNPEKIKKGQGTLTWAVIGIAIIFGAYSLVNFIITSTSGVTTGG